MTSSTGLDYAARLLRRGRLLEGLTLGWNVIGIVVSAIAALQARSVALAGFGLDSLIEIGASSVVLWELSGTPAGHRLDRAHRGRDVRPRLRQRPHRPRSAGGGPTPPPGW